MVGYQKPGPAGVSGMDQGLPVFKHTHHIEATRNQPPRHEACTGSDQTTQAWGLGLPRASVTSEKVGLSPEPTAQLSWLELAQEGLRGEGIVQRVGGTGQRELGA